MSKSSDISAVASLLRGKAEYRQPSHPLSTEEKVDMIWNALFGESAQQDSYYDKEEYESALRSMIRGDKKPLEAYMKRGGRVPVNGN